MYAGGSHCGQKVKIVRADDPSKSVIATVADSCPTCTNAQSLDLSWGAFKQIATAAEGMVAIKWAWV